MTDFRELSRLPEDERYWRALEERIVGELAPVVHDVATTGAAWSDGLAANALRLGALAAAAGIAALLILPARAVDREVPAAGLLRLPEDDPALVAMLTADAPPALASLLISAPKAGPW